jgi:uncharacterized protein (TIGR00369 family)
MMPETTPATEDVRTRWREEEEAVRRRLASSAGSARPDQLNGRTGLQFFNAIFAGELPRPPIGDTLDFVPIRIERGAAVFRGRPQLRHYNPLGSVHGGWFATLLDSAMGCAVHSTLPAGKGYTTLELKVNIVRPLTSAVPVVRAEGKLIHAGRQIAGRGTSRGPRRKALCPRDDDMHYL